MKLLAICLVLPFFTAMRSAALSTPNGNGSFSSGYKITLDYKPAPSSRRHDAASTNLGLMRRQMSYPINQCPQQASGTYRDFTDFRGSRCLTDTHSGAWEISCNPPIGQTPPFGIPFYWYDGSCRPHEICIDRPVDPSQMIPHGQYSTAWCVAGSAMVTLSQAALANDVRRVQATPQDRWSMNENIEIILTGQNDDDILFKAHEITLGARDTNKNPVGQPISCSECSNLRFSNWPQGTANFDSNITLPNVNDIANLHMVSWS
ncbi:hypothetical protein EV356DRAFT_568035 [Viridothelium virens]|uniref:Lytic polysaccharide monooxygenase n=1 Tax=Viridothelium virens TaxID=1048519 RepID=A0A6A6H6C8_VIRVR|nr:hypothetical protein EV356DRAFT_568035 [Viridothelium virens]